MLIIDVAILSIVVGTIIPILVGIITTKLESSKTKGLLLLTLSAVSGLATTAIAGNGIFTKESVIAAAVAYVTGVASYYGVYKPTGVSDYAQEKLGRKS